MQFNARGIKTHFFTTGYCMKMTSVKLTDKMATKNMAANQTIRNNEVNIVDQTCLPFQYRKSFWLINLGFKIAQNV